MSDHIGDPNGMIDDLGDANKMVCPHCGLPADRNQNGIQGYRCGSSYCETFRPQWARSMTCLEIQNGQLQERLKRMEMAGDAMAKDFSHFWTDRNSVRDWPKAKEAKP